MGAQIREALRGRCALILSTVGGGYELPLFAQTDKVCMHNGDNRQRPQFIFVV